MSFLIDTQTLKTGLVIFRRADVKHRNWYCRIKVPDADRYKTVSLKTADINAARDKAFEQDAEVRFQIKHEIPIFNKQFSLVAQEYSAFQKERSEAGQITHHRWRVLDSHNASSIASTIQQMSISFGVAAAGLTTAFFVPDRFRSNPGEMIHGLHEAFLALGGFTILSTIVFCRLKRDDGANVSHPKDLHLG